MNKRTTLLAVLAMSASSAFAHNGVVHEDARADVPFDWQPRAKAPSTNGGEWGPVEEWPVLGVHGTVLPTGNVFVWDATPDDFDTEFDGTPTNFHDSQRNQTRVTVWNPKTNTHTQTYNPEGTGDLFCAGSVHLTDGRIIFVGGDSGVGGKNGPSANSTIYDPWTNRWSTTDNLNAARWYASSVSLPTGQVMTVGGSYTPFPYAEILGFNKQWREYEGQFDDPIALSGDYAWLSVVSDGSVAYVGPHNRVDSLYTKELFQRDAWIDGGRRDAEELPGELGSYRGYGSYATYDQDKVLVSGGASSVHSAVIVDTKTRQTVETDPMHFGRRQHNLTILADGQVLATGGNSSGVDLYDPDNGVLTPELWNPDTGEWSIMNDMAVDRQYHSIALLLPDARVLLAGSGYCVPCFTFDHEEQNAEIFSPPYLFNGPRPVITAAPEQVNYGNEFNLNFTGDVARVNFIKLSSVTHSQSQDQRLVKGEIVANNNGVLTVRAPESRMVAPPGHYMVFAVNAAGVPSEAAIMSFGGALVQDNDVMLNISRADHWEYYEIQGRGAHTLTVNFNANLAAASVHVRNLAWPDDPTVSGFDSCTIIDEDQQQCTVTAANDAQWFVGVNGVGATEFGLSFDIQAGQTVQGTTFVEAPNTPALTRVNDGGIYGDFMGDVRVSWNPVDGAESYEIFRDGRLVNTVSGTSHLAANLQAMRTYSFQVLAVAPDRIKVCIVSCKTDTYIGYSVHRRPNYSVQSRNPVNPCWCPYVKDICC